MFKYIAILSILLLVLVYTKKDTAVSKLKANDTILALGDSITYGFGVQENQSYPSILSQLSNHKVINAGINGDTSAEALQRFPSILKDKSIKLMLLCLGGNDILQKKTLKEIKTNLLSIIKIAKQNNVKTILISVPNFSLFGFTPLDLYEELSEEEDVEFIEGLLSNILGDNTLKNDYIHPNGLGYKLMADEVYNYLQSNDWVK